MGPIVQRPPDDCAVPVKVFNRDWPGLTYLHLGEFCLLKLWLKLLVNSVNRANSAFRRIGSEGCNTASEGAEAGAVKVNRNCRSMKG